MRKALILRFINFWPPYFGAGIRVRELSKDFRSVRVEMGFHFWNRNYVRVQFGGSLYSMIDPMYMLMVMENLGPDYIVWDKSASIRFKRPGRGKVRAHCKLTEGDLEKIRQDVLKNGKAHPEFAVTICDDAGNVIAEVTKVLSVKLKGSRSPASDNAAQS